MTTNSAGRLIVRSVLVLTLAFLVVSHVRNQTTAGTPSETREIVLGMRFLKELLRRAGPDAAIAIVRFATDVKRGYAPGERGGSYKKVSLPATYITFGSKGSGSFWQLHVEGTFSLVKELRGHFTPLGHVNQDVPLPFLGRGREGKDPLRPLYHLKEGQQPLVLLVIMPDKAKGILDSTLLGPLSARDVKHLAEVARLLAKEPLSKMRRQRAERLLDAANPLLVLFGLVRLEELHVLSARDFGRAIDGLPTAYAAVTVRDMLDWAAFYHGSRSDVTKELSDFFRTAPPKRQQSLLKAVNDVLAPNPHVIGDMVNLADLQATARAYRATIANDPARREVVRELDTLLKLREKK